MVRRHVAAVALAALVFGCGGDWFKGGAPEGVELLVEGLEIPAWADWGETIIVTNTVRNWGTTSVFSAFEVNFYLSSNAYYTGSPTDYDFAQPRQILTILGQESKTEDTSLLLPSPGALPPGLYYIIAYVDEANAIDEIEGGEEDNISIVGPIDIKTPPAGIDLVTKYVSCPAAAEWGDFITVDYTVRNRGTAACSSAFDIDFYLSDDDEKDVFDQLLGTDTGVVLGAQAEYDGTAGLSLPGPSTDGNYYIIGVASTTGSDSEIVAGAMPNDRASEGTIYIAMLSDLRVSSVTPSGSPYYWGNQINVAVVVREARGYPSPPGTLVRVELWLSKDSILGGDDQFLRTLSTSALSGSESRTISASVTLSKNPIWTGSSHYIIAEIDPQDDIPEDNEANNRNTSASMTITDSPVDIYEPNNTRGTAYALGSTPNTSIYTHIRPTGDEDWYSFTIPYSGWYHVYVYLYPPFTEDYDLYLYRGATLIGWSTFGGPGATESIWVSYLSAGTYYIQVEGKNAADFSDSAYQLNISVYN